jgi:hypothetical protein
MGQMLLLVAAAAVTAPSSTSGFIAPSLPLGAVEIGGASTPHRNHHHHHHYHRRRRRRRDDDDANDDPRRRERHIDRVLRPLPPSRRRATVRGGATRLAATIAGGPGATSNVHAGGGGGVGGTFAAGATLLLSAASGAALESRIPGVGGGGGGSGRVFALLAAAFLSNVSRCSFGSSSSPTVSGRSSLLPVVPSDHFLYDACWTIALPSSLLFSLLSSPSYPPPPPADRPVPPPRGGGAAAGPSGGDPPPRPSTAAAAAAARAGAMRRTILRMMLPFLAGCVGSVLGCVVSHRFVDVPLVPSGVKALLAGCLAASYIGGTVNFFATARALRDDVAAAAVAAATPATTTAPLAGRVGGGNNGDVDAAMGSAFGSVAAADLVVMAAYFAMLQAGSRSTRLHRLFPSERRRDAGGEWVGVGGGGDAGNGGTESTSSESTSLESTGRGGGGDRIERDTAETSRWRGATVSAAALAIAFALASVAAATRLERRVIKSFPPPFNPPGTMCAFLALLGLALERSIGFVVSRSRGRRVATRMLRDSLGNISDVSPALSDASFRLLFAAVGSAADLSSAVAGGPAALAFASVALLVHSVTTLALSWAGTRLWRCLGGASSLSTTWEELLTASNAAIGGPSTAAAFAAGLIPADNDGSDESIKRGNRRSALVIAATFWGVFGYAIATGEYIPTPKTNRSFCHVDY